MLLILGPLAVLSLRAQAVDIADEYEIKAAMYVNMLRLVDWPAGKRPEGASPLVVGVIGSDEMARALESLPQSKAGPGGRRFTVKRLPTGAALADCNSVFVGGGDRKRIASALQAIGKTSILTVGENDKFLSLGGMIDLTVRDDRVQIEVNLDLAQSVGLSISSQLLKIAVVKNGAPR